MWSTAQRAELMASLGPLNPSAGSQRNIHTSCNSLPLASTALHSTHPFMWSMVPLSLSNPYILRSTLTSPLSKLPTVWTTAPSQIHNSNPNPFPRLPIHISNGLLNLFTLLFSGLCIQHTPTKLINFPTSFLPFLSSWFLLWNCHSQRVQGPAEVAAFSSACTQHYEYAC